ncbi:hypothetical protein XBFM1_520068 [Xenorhabdus bovienii str. feltiae Moldova]|uniref:Uncharacterized protein n=1 Tax=Xenorhabdus bovienii str. feltiae Moldova TaxID=1398200 RepID=A0A077NZH7_XENBV|nr:hypothetical protein XBFM1_520068 [Xenorhabdus bovienii str. feltiae Moldova]
MIFNGFTYIFKIKSLVKAYRVNNFWLITSGRESIKKLLRIL